MENVVLIAVILLAVGLAIWYLLKSKKNGKKCIGCPYQDCCSTKSKPTDPSCCSNKIEAK